MDVARKGIKDDPVVRIVELGPDETCGGRPAGSYLLGPPQDDMVADAGQLTVPWAWTLRPRTVASTTGSAAIAARPMNARRSVSTEPDCGAVGSGFESSRFGRELSAIRQPAVRRSLSPG
jgi:hypothetical protein